MMNKISKIIQNEAFRSQLACICQAMSNTLTDLAGVNPIAKVDPISGSKRESQNLSATLTFLVNRGPASPGEWRI